MSHNYRLEQADPNSAVRALSFFGFVIVAALSLAIIFAIIFSSYFGTPRDQSDFMMMTIIITACVAGPMGAIAAQNQYRVDRYHATLEAMASTDPLTGLLNRRAFKVLANEEISRMQRTDHGVCIVTFDIDNFKQVNDAHGHAFGDRVLTSIANISHAALRGPFDRLGRWGGEEFVILLTNVNVDQAQSVCERLRERIASTDLTFNGTTVRVTASFGIAPLTKGCRLEESLEAADQMLYRAKSAGRNKVMSVAPLKSVA